ncbi:hypothetical protein BYT27DRAFT_7199720 [Phlegmacium glaucopus]|nr:hypothetical protein BYT27DRAFT_7199720 [Phlegmacium glaucopus]
MDKSSNKGPVRTSKFSQKLSSLKAMIRRKTKDDNAVANTNPYSAQSRRDSKPYMSHPMLPLSNPTPSFDNDLDDVSDQSDRSAPFTFNRYPASHTRKVSTQSTASNGFPTHDGQITKNQLNGNGTGTGNVYPNATLQASIENSRASDESIPNSLRRGGVRGLFKPPLSKYSEVGSKTRPSTPPSISLPPMPTISLPPIPTSLPSPSNDDTVGSNVQVFTTTPIVDKPDASTDRPSLVTYSSTPALPSKSLSVTSDGSNGTGSSARDGDNMTAFSVSAESPLTVPDVPKRERVNPKLTVNTMLDDGNNAGTNSTINTSSSQQPLFPPRRTVSTAPRLSLPPSNYRFSINLLDGYSARMSPSVILRPPPLPLLNLPVFSGNTSTAPAMDAASSRRARRAGLMSMPALPRQGSSRGVAGHEEFDDAEVDEDEDEDDGDDVNDDDDDNPDSALIEDEMDTPRSGNSSVSETISSSRSRSRAPSISSYETPRTDEPSSPQEEYFVDFTRPPERRFSRSPFLPPVDMSRIDLSFLDSPPSSKGKVKDLAEDAGRTPIATVRSNRNSGTRSGSRTPTAFSAIDFSIPERMATDTWAPSPVITKSGQAVSPTLTPRPGGHFNFPLPVPGPASPHPILPTRSAENRLSVSMNTITQFPGTYKRASRSLIDVHALEKKEKVEQMVREEEEDAEEERKRRVKSMRMSIRFAVDGANATTMQFDQPSSGDRDEDGQLKTSPLRKRMSLAPYCVDGDDEDPIKSSGELEASSAVTKPKKTNNRISLAPAYDTIIPLRRRLSMPTFNAASTAPPPYPDLFPKQTYGVKLTQIQPRDDEGREKLPSYSNSIHLKAIMPRKLEFSQPGVQAKDRKWKKVLCVLDGTALKIYKPPGVSGIGGWWESKVGSGDIADSVTTTSSFNLGGGRPKAQGGGAIGVGERKVEVERDRERMTEANSNWPMLSQPSDTSLSNQRQGPRLTTSSSSYPSSATPGGGGSNTSSTSTNGVLPATKSALNLAVHLLKPSRGHGRTISDVGQTSNTPSGPRSPRPSLQVPRNGRSTPTPTIASTTTRTSISSSRSPSPVFASSSSMSATSSSSHRSTHSMSSSIGGGSFTASSSTSKGKKKAEDPDPLLSEPDANNLIKAYTMQQAECGLGTDYLKRKHVIRVRLEGEQFLMQARDVDSVIEWIEGLQAATNVAMDLDERLMPRGPLFPRRRRRRRVVVPTTIDVAGIPQVTRIVSPTGTTPVDALQLAPPLVWSV